jgi:hypothetical protein
VGTFVGGHLAHALVGFGGFRALWMISTLVRMGVIWSLLRSFMVRSEAAQLLRAQAKLQAQTV